MKLLVSGFPPWIKSDYQSPESGRNRESKERATTRGLDWIEPENVGWSVGFLPNTMWLECFIKPEKKSVSQVEWKRWDPLQRNYMIH